MTLLVVEDLVVRYPLRRRSSVLRGRFVEAVAGVSLQLAAGRTLALVGESGSGKTTVARAILQLVRPASGSVRFDGRELVGLSARELRAVRRELQVVFADPSAALDPRMPVADLVAEPLLVHGLPADSERVAALLHLVGLGPELADRFPHELSGGQRQRVGIARAVALEPRLLVLDEPVSALDASARAGVVNLLADLRQRLGMAYLFIAHDLALVRHVADDVAVVYRGRVVETGPVDAVLGAPRHPYTQALVAAEPTPDPPAPGRAAPPAGCRYRDRCPRAAEICDRVDPPLAAQGDVRVACHFPGAR